MKYRKARLRQMLATMRAAKEFISTPPDQIDPQTRRNIKRRLDSGIINALKFLSRDR